MKCVGNQILFKPFLSEGVTESGLFIPDTARELLNRGTIVDVGSGTKKEPMRLEKGMVAHRVKNWGEEIIIDGEKYYIMDQKAILAIE